MATKEENKNIRLAVDLDGSGLEGEILGVDRDSLRGLMDGQAWQVERKMVIVAG